jgi:hypothetical protein
MTGSKGLVQSYFTLYLSITGACVLLSYFFNVASFHSSFLCVFNSKRQQIWQFRDMILSDTINLQAIISNKLRHSFLHFSLQSPRHVCGSPSTHWLRCNKTGRLSEHTLFVEQYVTDRLAGCCAYCAKLNNHHLDYTSPRTNQHESFKPYRRQSMLTHPSTVENLGWVHTCNVTVSWQCGRDSRPRNVSKVGYALTLRACPVCCQYLAVASKGW